MRILFLNDDYPPRGNSSVSTIVVNLARELEAQGHEIHIVTTHRTEERSWIERNGNVVSLPVSYRISLRHWFSLRNPRVSRMVKEEMKRIRPDVVHAHNIHTYLTYDALRIARKFTPRVFLTTHDVMSFAYGRLKTDRYLASLGKDVTVTMGDNIRTIGLQWNPLRNFLIRRTLRRYVTKVCAVSDALKRALEANGIGNVTVVPNGIDLGAWTSDAAAQERLRNEWGLHKRKVILFGGRLSVDKGVVPLLHALDRLRTAVPSVLLLVVGDQKRWDGLARQAGFGNDLSGHWRCTGWLPHSLPAGRQAQMPDAYGVADVVAVPSLCLDCFPSMNLEAMAARKPIVGTIFGGTPEMVEHGMTGLVCDPRDTATFAESLQTLLENDELARAMGEAGRRRVEKEFTVALQAQRYLKMYMTD